MMHYFQKFFKPKPKLFTESALNDSIHNSGFVTFPLLDKSEIDRLSKFFDSNTNEDFKGFHASMFHSSLEYKTKCNEEILLVLNNKIEGVLRNSFKLLFGNFMVKEPGIESEMKIHQDWTYVDENKQESFAIWIPLIDLTDQNGALHILPNSHEIKNFVRGPGIDCPFEENWEEHKKSLKPQFLKAGEAIVWNHRIAHYSPPNNSNSKRIAITAIIVPKNTPIVHYFQNPSEINEVLKYEVNSNFFLGYNIKNGPEGLTPVKKFNYRFKAKSAEFS